MTDRSPRYAFRLFIEGDRGSSHRAKSHAAYLCQHISGGASLEIIDVAANPEIAFREKLLTLPVLIRLRPLPTTRLVGDLSDTGALFMYFGVLRRMPYGTPATGFQAYDDDDGKPRTVRKEYER